MFDITDPLGRGRIRELEFELKRQKREMQGQIEYYQERALEASHVASYLAGLMEEQYKDLQESRRAYRDLSQMFAAGEEARRSLGEKHREVNNQKDTLERRLKELIDEYDQLSAQYAGKQRELEELYAEHEALVREIRDGQHGDVAAEPEAMSA